MRLAGIAEQRFDLGRPKITRVDGYDGFAMLIIGLLFYAGALPDEVDVKTCRSHGDKFADTVLHSGGDDVVDSVLLLKHQPLHLYVIAGVPPVALGIKVAEVELVLQAELDARQGAGHFAGDK